MNHTSVLFCPMENNKALHGCTVYCTGSLKKQIRHTYCILFLSIEILQIFLNIIGAYILKIQDKQSLKLRL